MPPRGGYESNGYDPAFDGVRPPPRLIESSGPISGPGDNSGRQRHVVKPACGEATRNGTAPRAPHDQALISRCTWTAAQVVLPVGVGAFLAMSSRAMPLADVMPLPGPSAGLCRNPLCAALRKIESNQWVHLGLSGYAETNCFSHRLPTFQPQT